MVGIGWTSHQEEGRLSKCRHCGTSAKTSALLAMSRKLSAHVSRRRSISVTISETEHEAVVLSLSAIHQPLLAPQRKPCPRITPTLPLPLPPLPPTFNRSSILPWTRTRRRQKPSFSLIPLPPNYSPVIRPQPFCRSFKASSSNSITVAGAMRG